MKYPEADNEGVPTPGADNEGVPTPGTDNEASAIIVSNGTLVKVVDWLRQSNQDGNKKATLLFALVRLCSNEKQCGYIRAGESNAMSGEIVICYCIWSCAIRIRRAQSERQNCDTLCLLYIICLCAEYLVPLVVRYSFSHHDRWKVELLLRKMQTMAVDPIVDTVAPPEGQANKRTQSQC